jgi:hypothetical protein
MMPGSLDAAFHIEDTRFLFGFNSMINQSLNLPLFDGANRKSLTHYDNKVAV